MLHGLHALIFFGMFIAICFGFEPHIIGVGFAFFLLAVMNALYAIEISERER